MMPFTTMTWTDLEVIVADTVLKRYSSLRSDERRRDFCEDIGLAYSQLCKTLRLKDKSYEYNASRVSSDRENNKADYSMARIGEAYALQYHLHNADNIYTALSQIRLNPVLPANTRILDVGSGTGSGAMAIAYWIAKNCSNLPDSVSIEGVEPAKPMRAVASILLNDFYKSLKKTLDPASQTFPFQWQHSTATSLDNCVQLPEEVVYDLALFSHTFHLHEPDERKQQVVEVAKRVKPGGVIAFLIPNILDKKHFINVLGMRLERQGNMKMLDITPIDKRYRNAPLRNPKSIIKVRSELNQKCQNFGIPNAFGEDPKDDPYYGWYCTLKAFIKV